MSITETSRSIPVPQSAPSVVIAGASRPSGVLLGGLVSVSVVLVWLLIIYNRFLTPHEGWFSYYGLLMKNGKVPYRDFYFFTQPFHLLLARVISELSDKLVYFRIYGLVERVILTAVYYYLLSRRFSAPAAVCGTIASSLFFLSYATDALFSYLYTCLLFLLVALACLHKAWQSDRRRTMWMVLAGVSTALCFFTKQSNGLLAIAGIGFTIVVIAVSFRRAALDLLGFTSGLIFGALPFLLWLFWSGAWQAYLNQVFFGAASSKGGLRAVLFGFMSRQVSPWSTLAFTVLVIVAAGLIYFKRLSLIGAPAAALHISPWLTIGAVAATSLLGILFAQNTFFLVVRIMHVLTLIVVNVVLYTLLPILALVLWRRFARPGWSSVQGYEVPVALLIASVYWTYGCGMSWSVSQQFAIPTLGLALAFLYDRIQIGRTRIFSVLLLLTAISIAQVGIWSKWNSAFDWEGWSEKISSDRARSRWPQIADFEIARNEAAMYDTIFDDIAKHTKPGEPIVTLFTIPLFNFVGQHWQPTFAPVHYWDVCPDDVAAADAKRVKALRPRMIVELQLADWVWKEHDEGWRAGHRSGQREFKDAIDSLTSSGDYRKLHTFLTPRANMNLVVWLRER